MSNQTTTTRRTVLSIAGASAVGTTLAGAAASAGATSSSDGGDDEADADWTVVETPVDVTLHDVAYTAEGAYAVGGGGVVLERTTEGWRTVLDGGPTGNGNDLYGADVTDGGSASDASGTSSDGTSDGGEALWFVGASGAIGELDVVSGTLDDHSAPNDYTNNFRDVAVAGRPGDANVYVAGDSGAIHYSFADGETGSWGYQTPGSGSSLPAIDVYGPRDGHAVDTNGTVFATDDGTTWEAIGIPDAGVNFYGVDADAPDDVTVAGGNGSIFRWDGTEWRPTSVGDASYRDVEAGEGSGLAVGGGGVVAEFDGREWSQLRTPTGQNLRAVATGSTDLAVGAGGTVLER